MFLSASGQLGGAETSLLEILGSLRVGEPSWELHLVVAGDGPLLARASALGVTATSLPFAPPLARLGESGATFDRRRVDLVAQCIRAVPSAWSYLHRLRAVIRAAGPDILHTNGLKMHVLGAMAAGGRAMRGRPKVVWHLHDYLGPRPLSARLLRWNRARCAAVIANSESVARDARLVLGEAVNVAVVHNGIDLQRFSADGERLDLDRLAGVPPAPPGTIRVGLLGTFARWKGHETFLRAIAALPPDVHVRAYVVGDAVYASAGSQYSRQELMDVATRLGLGDRVAFTGFVEAPEAALRALDVVVHASTSPEPFGLVIAEAMASERPVIVSLAGGAAEIVTDGVDALGHTPGDAAALTARIAQLAADGALRVRLAREGRATAQRSFDRRRLPAELAAVYRRAVGLAA